MGRIRTIKPEFWTDSLMVGLPPLARLLYIALWTASDDHGYIPDEPDRISMEVMPREDPLQVDDWIQMFLANGRLELWSDGNGATFFRVSAWEKHQKVDKPGKSRVFREGSRKLAIPLAVRRGVAEKYGCSPGGDVEASCFYCGTPGRVHWHKDAKGRPTSWVTFPGLELDHLECESNGGDNSKGNIVLACRSCNRSKGTKHWIKALCEKNFEEIPELLARAREGSGTEQGTGKGKERNGSESSPIDSHMVAMAVRTELSLGGNQILMALEDVCKAEISKGTDPEQLRDSLIKAFRDYEIAKPKLEYSKGTMKFFAEGDWRNPLAWPWKKGETQEGKRRFIA